MEVGPVSGLSLNGDGASSPRSLAIEKIQQLIREIVAIFNDPNNSNAVKVGELEHYFGQLQAAVNALQKLEPNNLAVQFLTKTCKQMGELINQFETIPELPPMAKFDQLVSQLAVEAKELGPPSPAAATVQQLIREIVAIFNDPNNSNAVKVGELEHYFGQLQAAVNALQKLEPNNPVVQSLTTTCKQMGELINQFETIPELPPMAKFDQLMTQLAQEAQILY